MSHHAFVPTAAEDSPYFTPEYVPLFKEVREVTSYKRPPGSHGCQLTEIVPGKDTACYCF